MKTFNLLFAVTLFAVSTSAQTFDFVKHLTSSGVAWPLDMETDAQGNIFVCGSFLNTIDLDPGAGTSSHTSNGDRDAYVAKYSPTGQFLWGYAFGSTHIDICTALAVQQSTGNVTVVGQFQGTVLLPGNTQMVSHDNGNMIDAFSVSLTSSGTILGAFSIGGSSGFAKATDVAYSVPDEATFYIYGTFAGTIDADGNSSTSTNLTAVGNDCFMARYNSSLNLLWAKSTYGTNQNETSTRMVVHPFGKVTAVGYFDGETDFDPGPGTYNVTPHGAISAFVWKLDGNGDVMWAHGFGSATNTFAYDVAEAANGDLLIVGSYEGVGDMDPSAAISNLPMASGKDGFVNRLTSTGTYVSSYHFGGSADNEVSTIAVHSNGNILLAGYFQGDVDTDPSAGTNSYTSIGNADGFMAEYDANMAHLWSVHLQGTVLNRPRAVCYQETNSGQLLAADFGGTATVPATGGVTFGSATGNDPYFARFYDLTIDVDHQEPSENSISFDAHNNQLRIELQADHGTLNIFGMNGELLRAVSISRTGAGTQLPLSGLAAGMYVAQLVSGNTRTATKLSLIY